MRRHAFAIRDIIPLLQAVLGTSALVGADRGPDNRTRCGPDSRAASTAHGGSQAGTQRGTDQGGAHGTIVRGIGLTGNPLARIVLADLLVLLVGSPRSVGTRIRRDG